MPFDQTNPLHESHSVETPEQTDLGFIVAGVGSRFLALLIDTAIQFGVCIVALILFTIFGITIRSAGAWFAALFIICLFLLLYGYFILFEILWNGQTPGKRALNIRVIKDSGRQLSPVETIGRNLLRIVDQMPGFYGFGILVALLNKQNKRLGDFAAGAIVIREADTQSLVVPQSFRRREFEAPVGAASLTEEDVILIESFMHRRYELPPDVRSRIAQEIFRKLEPKLTFQPQDRTSMERPGVERILEAAVYDRRSRLE